MPKILVANTNEGQEGELLLWQVSGDLPPNYVMDAPEEARSIEDLDIDIENNVAIFNESKQIARLAAEAAAKAAR